MTRVKPEIIIEQLTSFSAQDADSIRRLTTTIGKNYKPLTDTDLTEICASPTTILLVAREKEKKALVGMITIAVYRIPYVKKAYIDDLVVDEEYRGLGIGSSLLNKAIMLAKAKEASYVDFTSRPRRDKSNKLYEKLGFIKRETNVYRLTYDYAEV